MMLLVIAVTAVTLYLAEKNLRQKNQEWLAAQFQSDVRHYLTLEDARLSGIKEKCRTLAQSVRLRAALEERDADDLYRNALTELRDVLAADDSSASPENSTKASFVRFVDSNGKVLPPGNIVVGANSYPELTTILQQMAPAFRSPDFQTSAIIALSSQRDLSALRQIIVTTIVDWNGAQLGALVLGFPLRGFDSSPDLSTGIFSDGELYISDLSAADRAMVAQNLKHELTRAGSNNFEVSLQCGPHLVFYKEFAAVAQLPRTYAVCLFPLASWLDNTRDLRWKIIALGAVILVAGFTLSLLFVRKLAKPVDRIVAGSVENLTKRQQAEEGLREANRQLAETLTELRATQRQVIQQERLSAIGQMASGIAHDFNNSLTPILGFSELLLNNEHVLQNPIQSRRFLEMLHTSAQDAANVVSRLREFYRPAEANTEFPAVQLTTIVQQAIALTEPKWKAQAQAAGVNINVKPVFDAAPVIAGEEAALREVLTNLIFNAVDAMPDGGSIVLHVSTENHRAILRITDTGTGMSEEVRQRCLEPFFSTKGERGTGLGLSMVYGIVQRHRGQLQIESAPGFGTTFVIQLPLADDAVAPVSVAAPMVTRTGLNILVVDDDEMVCEVVAEYLRGDGHNVVVAHNGEQAVDQVSQHRLDVVFLDRAMPGLSGDQTAELIKKTHPHLPIILLTGFGALIEVSGSQPRAVDAVLGKPVTLGMLRQTIDKLLHAA